MRAKENSVNKNNGSYKSGKGLFIFAIFFSITTVSIDIFVDNELFSRVMFYFQQKTLPPFNEIKPYQLLLTTLFSFGIPLSMVITFIYAIRKNQIKTSYSRLLTISSFLILAIVVLTPAILGREMNEGLFGITGFIILTSLFLTYWFISNFRYHLNNEIRTALDFKLLGYLCFGIVTWQVCGFTTAPAFAIYPEKMIELEVRPFAIGQLKSIMVYFALGWILTAIGFYKQMKYFSKKHN